MNYGVVGCRRRLSRSGLLLLLLGDEVNESKGVGGIDNVILISSTSNHNHLRAALQPLPL